MLLVMVFFWSGNYIVGKFALREFPPLLLSGLRVSVAGVLMLPVYWWDRLRGTEDSWRREVWLLVGLGVMGIAMNQVFFVQGLNRTSVAHAAIIIGITPILVLLLAALRRQERITARKLTGMFTALAGIVLLKSFEVQPPDGRGPTWAGDGFVFLGALSFALFTVFGKGSTKRHSSITVNTVAYVGAALCMAPITVWQSWGFDYARVTLVGWSSLFYMAAFPSVLCYLIYYYALAHLTPSRVSAFSYLQPPLVTAMGVVFLREHITWALVGSALVVFAGVYITERG